MKNLICFVSVLLMCSACSTTKVLVDYKGLDLIKEYKVIENKEVKRSFSNLFPMYDVCKNADIKNGQKPPNRYATLWFFTIPIDIITMPFLLIYDLLVPNETSYSYNTFANIEGKIMDTNQNFIDNKKILLGFEDENTGLTETIYSNKNGVFKSEISNKNKQYHLHDKIILNFNNGTKISTFNNDLHIGKDVSINNPNEISFIYPFEKRKEIVFYLRDNNIDEKEIEKDSTTNIVTLRTQTFSSKYYKEKIEKIEQATKMLKEAGLKFTPETLILDRNKNIKDNWEKIIKALISADKMFKKVGVNYHISTIELIILDENKNLKGNWKELVKEEINNEKFSQNKLTKTSNRVAKIIKDPDSCNLTYKNEQEIFDATDFDENNISLNMSRAIEPLVYFNNDAWISATFQIYQVLGNNQFIFKAGQNNKSLLLFYGKLKKCCRKEKFYEGEFVDIAGVIDGVYVYNTVMRGINRIPKVDIYAIRKSKIMQNWNNSFL